MSIARAVMSADAFMHSTLSGPVVIDLSGAVVNGKHLPIQVALETDPCNAATEGWQRHAFP